MCSPMSFLRFALAVGLLLAGGFTMPAAAQQTQTLLIRDGDVYINGRLAEPEDLPDDLETRGIEARFSFAGDATPVFSLGQRLYKLVDGQLLPVEANAETADDVSVYFRDGSGLGAAAAARDPLAPAPGARAPSPADGVYSVRLQQRLGELQQEAQALQRQSGQTPDPATVQQFDHLIQQFEQVVQSSRAFPEMQEEQYLSEVQQQNQDLYRRLVREWQMERETHRLADSIRRLPDGPQRAAQVDLLRDLLDQIFELKQQNREEEIAALKERLLEAQDRLDQREDMRSQIIDRRLQQLIGSPEPRQ